MLSCFSTPHYSLIYFLSFNFIDLAMVFDLDNLFKNSSESIKYGLQPFPSYFQTYDWKKAEEEADDCIKAGNLAVSRTIKKIQKNLKRDKVIIKITSRFNKDFINLPGRAHEEIISKVIPLLLTNAKDSSLRAKEIDEYPNRWRIIIDLYYCFTLEMRDGDLIFRCIGPSGSH